MLYFQHIKILLSKFPICFYIFFKTFRSNDNRIVDKHSQLVVEGFPRSANTFCYSIFKVINPNLIISSHIHLPVNINLGLKRNIPCIVIIREPIDSIVSYIIRERVDAKFALSYYLFFHENLIINNSKLLIVKFSTLTKDLPKVLKKFNSNMKLDFDFDQDLDIFKGRVFDYVKNMDMNDTGEKEINHRTVALPSNKRKSEKDKYIKLIHSDYGKLLKKCNSIYDKILKESKNIV